MKKIVLILISLIFIVCIGFYFSQKNKSNTTQVVTFWTLQMADFSEYMNEVISNFEKQNPDIKINWIDIPFSEGEKRTLASVLSDEPADLINLNPDFSAILAEKGVLEEINDEYVEQYKETIIEALKYNGKLYALPWYATSAVTVYNKDVFDRVNAKIPSVYEDFNDISEVIKSKTGKYAFIPSITENDTMYKILNKYGITTPEAVLSDESMAVFKFYKDLYDKNLIPVETITLVQSEVLEKYMSENVVFFTAGVNFLNMIKENSPSVYEKTDVAPQIKGKLGQNDFSCMNLVVPLKAKHKDGALKFALYLTNHENSLKLGKLANILSVNKYALEDNFYKEFIEGDLMSKARVLSAKQLESIEPAVKVQKKQKEVNLLINTAIQSILLGKLTVDEALTKLSHEWAKLQLD